MTLDVSCQPPGSRFSPLERCWGWPDVLFHGEALMPRQHLKRKLEVCPNTARFSPSRGGPGLPLGAAREGLGLPNGRPQRTCVPQGRVRALGPQADPSEPFLLCRGKCESAACGGVWAPARGLCPPGSFTVGKCPPSPPRNRLPSFPHGFIC